MMVRIFRYKCHVWRIAFKAEKTSRANVMDGRRERAYIDGEECWAHSVARAIRKVSTRKRIIDWR